MNPEASSGLSQRVSEVKSEVEDLRTYGLRNMFSSAPDRAQQMSYACGHLFVDFSKQFVSESIFDELMAIAREREISTRIASMMSGEIVNTTEQRAVLHTALRDANGTMPEAIAAQEELTKAFALADEISDAGYTDVVNIGIGGSDLGPLMAYRALRRFHRGPRVHFVSNVDSSDLDEALSTCNPASTLFVVVSKTFTTAETMRNADRALQWLTHAEVATPAQHFVACTSAPDVATKWGVHSSRVLTFWPWVGGRFSLSSVVGFSLMLGIGTDNFKEFLSGMKQIDEHFATVPLAKNVPVVHGVISFLNSSIMQWPSVAVIPYSHDLSRLPAFLQQLMMESNGKSVTTSGEKVSLLTSPVVWGEPGTNAQHAFFQLLHQGTQIVPVDFIGFAEPLGTDADAHDELMANMIAQSRALAFGRTHEEVVASGVSEDDAAHYVCEGNRPSTTVMATALTPRVLGELIALFEHSTAVQGWMMGVNSFDQWGVELGKSIAKDVRSSVTGAVDDNQWDSSTESLLRWYSDNRS